MRRHASLLLLLVLSSLAQAETRYVSDQLEITLRSGTSTKHQILRVLQSGTPVEILKEDPDSGYVMVRTRNGSQGWVLERFLMNTPSARDRLAAAEAKLARSEAELMKLRDELKDTRTEHQSVESERNRFNDENIKLNKELARIRSLSANAVQMSDDNEKLRMQVDELQRELQLTSQQNEALRDRSNRDWFVVGAMVVVGSMFLGILMTKIRWRKRSSWGDL